MLMFPEKNAFLQYMKKLSTEKNIISAVRYTQKNSKKNMRNSINGALVLAKFIRDEKMIWKPRTISIGRVFSRRRFR